MSKKMIVEVERDDADSPDIKTVRVRHGKDRGVELSSHEARQLWKMLTGLYQ